MPNFPTGREDVPHMIEGTPRNTYDEAGAKRLASEIRSYWVRRGFTTIRVEAVRSAELRQIDEVRSRRDGVGIDHNTWTVRSNLKNGLPPFVDTIPVFLRGVGFVDRNELQPVSLTKPTIASV